MTSHFRVQKKYSSKLYFGGKTLNEEQSRKYPLGSGDQRCPMWLSSDYLNFHSAAQRTIPETQEEGTVFAESISSQETEDAACSSCLPRGSLQHTVCSGIKSETQLVFCFHCFLSLLLAVEPSILLFLGRCDLLGAVHPIWASVFAWYELCAGN